VGSGDSVFRGHAVYSSFKDTSDENRIAACAKLVEIVEEDIQSRLEKGEILREPKTTFGLLRVPELKKGTKEFDPMARVRVLKPQGVVAGVLEPAKSVLKALKRIPIRGQKGQIGQSDPEKVQQTATDNSLKLLIELCATARQMASIAAQRTFEVE